MWVVAHGRRGSRAHLAIATYRDGNLDLHVCSPLTNFNYPKGSQFLARRKVKASKPRRQWNCWCGRVDAKRGYQIIISKEETRWVGSSSDHYSLSRERERD